MRFLKRLLNWQVVLPLTLLALSVAFYELHYLIFRDAHHIVIYLIGDIAFVFIEVLLVTLVIHRVLAMRERRSLLKKLNMVIGAFFSEVGTVLIRDFARFDPASSKTASALAAVDGRWSDAEFDRMRRAVGAYACAVDCSRGDLAALKRFLVSKRDFLLGLLENPNLLEHESFTNLLWAVFHLMEELAGRPDLTVLPPTDDRHLAGDIQRAYKLIVAEWLAYMKHLKRDYPYLFSLAMRTNPFAPVRPIEVRQ